MGPGERGTLQGEEDSVNVQICKDGCGRLLVGVTWGHAQKTDATAPKSMSDEFQPAPEMKKLYDAFAGSWQVTETFEISAELQGKNRRGTAYGVSRGGSGTKLATGVWWRPLSLTHFSSFVSVGPVSFTTVRDWTKLKCLSRLCPIAPADLTGTAYNKKA